MVNIQFLFFEILMLILVALCFRHARKEGIQAVLRLFAGILFGVMLEWATIKQLEAYSYGTFLLMIDNIPISIGMGWGVILYSSMLFSDHCRINEWFRPVLDGLLALNIDLAMDAIAIRIGMWDWGGGLSYDYFGVPYENFWAWFWVIFSFSMAFRVLNRLPGKLAIYIAPLGSIPLGVIGVLSANRIIVSYIPQNHDLTTIAIIFLGGLLFILSRKPNPDHAQMDSLVMWVPVGFHLYFLIIGVISGAIFSSWAILTVSLAMALIAGYIHYPVIRSR